MKPQLFLIVTCVLVGAILMAVIQSNISHAQNQSPGQTPSEIQPVQVNAVGHWIFNSELNVKRKGTSERDVTKNSLLLDTKTGRSWILRPAGTPEGYAWFELHRELD